MILVSLLYLAFDSFDSRGVFGGNKHVLVMPSEGQRFVFTLEEHEGIPAGQLGFSLVQRKWAVLSLNQDIRVEPYRFDQKKDFAATLTVAIDFYNKKKVTQEPFDTDAMAQEFLMQFHQQAFSVGQPMVFQFGNKPLLSVSICHIKCVVFISTGMEFNAARNT